MSQNYHVGSHVVCIHITSKLQQSLNDVQIENIMDNTNPHPKEHHITFRINNSFACKEDQIHSRCELY